MIGKMYVIFLIMIFVELSCGSDVVKVAQIPIIDFDNEVEEEVIINMQIICQDLKKSLEKRLKQLEIMKASLNPFKDYSLWYDPPKIHNNKN